MDERVIDEVDRHGTKVYAMPSADRLRQGDARQGAGAMR
jgi:hypothetical protein